MAKIKTALSREVFMKRFTQSHFDGALSIAAAALIGTMAPAALAGQTPVPSVQADQKSPSVKRSTMNYALPDVKLVRDDGKTVNLNEELNDGRTVFVNFIYTTCTTYCPVLSHTFSLLQKKLGGDLEKVHLLSISIDPERDSPARLVEYAKKFKAGPHWQHYTGTQDASIAIQQAFDVYRGDKMNHPPVALMRIAPGKPWLRFDGFASADDLAQEYQKQTAAK
jgi:protein SCO1/2